MVLVKDDQKHQGTITFKKMWETVSMGKGNAGLSFISGYTAQPKKICKYRKPIQKSKHILKHR